MILITTQTIDDLKTAADALRNGLLVAFPTETVYGLGADATNAQAIDRLFQAKGRPADNPLIVHLGDVNQLQQAARSVGTTAWTLLNAFSPGPITVVVKKNSNIVNAVSAGLDSVGIRIPGHAQAKELLQLTNRPIAAPSANLSGRPSCTTWQSVLEDLNGRVDYILKGDVSRIGIESTVVDCTGSQPVILRAGAVTLDQLRMVVPDIVCWQDQSDSIAGTGLATLPSPGLRHIHYQPKARIQLVGSLEEATDFAHQSAQSVAYFGLEAIESSRESTADPFRVDEADRFRMIALFQSVDQYAKQFYELLREADRRGIEIIYMQLVPDKALGAALRDRQLRAAGKSVSDRMDR